MKQTQTKADAAPAIGQHTPGPWYTRHGQVSSENSAHGCTIANCNRTAKGIPDAEVEANARLIASAPDLLAALRGIINQDDWEGEDIAPDSPIGKARAALARAERGEG